MTEANFEVRPDLIDTLALSGSFRVGLTTITQLSDGVVVAPRRNWFNTIEPSEWMPALGLSDPDTPFPVNFGGFLIQNGESTTLFDCGVGQGANALFPGIREGGNFVLRLKEAGVEPSDIDQVVISHLHIDHCGHLVSPDGILTFPRAEVWLQEREVEYWNSAASANNIKPDEIRRYIDAVSSAGLLRPYHDEFELSSGILLVPAQGHTPGHTAMLVESEGETALLLGDAVHHWIHFEHPAWLQSYDVEPPVSINTRTSLFDRAVSLDAIVTAIHMPILTLGRLTSVAGSYKYHALDPHRQGDQ
jgi:glyoxylase-like metal-dependent hydrolase (beta-lactamase superfamily II)